MLATAYTTHYATLEAPDHSGPQCARHAWRRQSLSRCLKQPPSLQHMALDNVRALTLESWDEVTIAAPTTSEPYDASSADASYSSHVDRTEIAEWLTSDTVQRYPMQLLTH